jgi:hypothetical protein
MNLSRKMGSLVAIFDERPISAPLYSAFINRADYFGCPVNWELRTTLAAFE